MIEKPLPIYRYYPSIEVAATYTTGDGTQRFTVVTTTSDGARVVAEHRDRDEATAAFARWLREQEGTTP